MGSGESARMRGSYGLAIQQQSYPAKGVVLLNIQGELDHHTLETLNEAIREVIDGGCFRLILDLSQIRYVSSGGIGVLIGTLAEVRASRGDLVLLRPHPSVQQVLETLGLAGEIAAADDLESAFCVFSASVEACATV